MILFIPYTQCILLVDLLIELLTHRNMQH